MRIRIENYLVGQLVTFDRVGNKILPVIGHCGCVEWPVNLSLEADSIGVLSPFFPIAIQDSITIGILSQRIS